MIIPVRLEDRGYDIVLEKGVLSEAASYLNLRRKVLIVTDDGVPAEYAECLSRKCQEPVIFTLPQGEANKTMKNVEEACRIMMNHEFTRKDCVVAVGGGICGDLAGFAASCYMRGVDFYNIPTTVLSQVDSSVGGKTAVNLDHIKNIVGAFYQPKKVLIDIDVLKTLPERQIRNGLAEALKMSMCFDPDLFELFETGDITENIERIIEKSLRIKEDVVRQDEREAGLRKVLNFGHTLGHGIEAAGYETGLNLYHGECVALGMIPMCSPEVRARLIPVLQKMNLPTGCSLPKDLIIEAMLHDKKMANGAVSTVRVEKIGSFEMKDETKESFEQLLSLVVKED